MTLLSSPKTETEKLRDWMNEQELEALGLLQQALVDIALESGGSRWNREIACSALRRMARDYPEVAEILFARTANAEVKRKTKIAIHLGDASDPQQIR